MKEVDVFEVALNNNDPIQLKLDLSFRRSCCNCGTRLVTKSETGYILCSACGRQDARYKRAARDTGYHTS